MDKYLEDSYNVLFLRLFGEEDDHPNDMKLNAMLKTLDMFIDKECTYANQNDALEGNFPYGFCKMSRFTSMMKNGILIPAIFVEDEDEKTYYQVFLRDGQIADMNHPYLIVHSKTYIEIYYYSSYRVANNLPLYLNYSLNKHSIVLENLYINLSLSKTRHESIATGKPSVYLHGEGTVSYDLYEFAELFRYNKSGRLVYIRGIESTY